MNLIDNQFTSVTAFGLSTKEEIEEKILNKILDSFIAQTPDTILYKSMDEEMKDLTRRKKLLLQKLKTEFKEFFHENYPEMAL